ncbi:ATP-binding cassette domain-containing protein [Demequina lignilytica]|uniref:ATP-binding cassette domain-containing protein n=1 Tax=Demequina lignilytica TaxID=3051663 RepID=A0AB35MKE2_9MICO|nr:ATP-binding cassette domain-containing protein [Demequina sp. SYSU T0a273]MDN4484280.1 ATP-binding cassette domain-containing protein [Demequina sp. SYSU T0a273]
MPALTFSHVSFAWPDGRALLDDLTWSLPDGLTALVGRNGIGKTTLIRLALGDLVPTAGRVGRPPSLAYVPQDVTLARGTTVALALGVAARLAALRAIEAGSADPAHYDVLADDWTVEESAHATLAGLGLGLGLDRPVERASGGEAVLLAVGAALLARPEVLILDEPTNNLDAGSRAALWHQLRARTGATLVVSHDRTLLAGVDTIAELRERDDRTAELRWYGGGLAAFEAARDAERAATDRAVTAATADVARQRRALAAHVEGAGRKRRAGEKARAERRVVGLVADAKKQQAERTDARVRGIHQERLADARGRLADARAALPRDRTIRIDLPGTTVPQRRLVLEASRLATRTGAVLDAIVRGPERIHLAGPNGSGKSTLVRTLLGGLAARDGLVEIPVPVGVLPQRLDHLDDAATVLDTVRRAAPDADEQEIRDRLGRFRLRGAAASGPVGTLSGGERFRAALACVLLARPAPQLLILDEPTNSLDLDSQAQLIEALEGFGGALLVVSHDAAFVSSLAPTRRWSIAAGPGDVVDEQLR